MSWLRRFAIAALLALSIAPAFAQAPPPVPALPDTERRTSYSLTNSTCACAVNFQIYGDAVDYQNWFEVFLNGVLVNYNDATYGWTITSPTGSLGTIPRPITDAVLTFNNAQTGTVQIVGARRPRRLSQFTENRGVAARDLNQVITDIVAMLREDWDKINDVTGRALISQPGVTIGPLPQPAACENSILGFDLTGANPVCLPAGGVIFQPATACVQDYLSGAGFTAGSTTQLMTTCTVGSSAAVLNVYFDGVNQNANTWTLSGQTVTFNAAIPLSVQVVELHAGIPNTPPNFVGPTVSVANDLPAFSGTQGNIVYDSGISISAVPAAYATRAAAIAANVPSGAATIVLQGYSSANDGGGGSYSRLGSTPSPVKAWQFQSADGAWWQLAAGSVYPKQLGAKLDGSTDDAVAMQAWLDYGATFSVPSIGQSGTANIPTETLNLSSNSIVDGLNVLTLDRTSNVVGSLLDCGFSGTPQSHIIVRNTLFSTTAGFSSVTSNTIGLTSQTYTVPAGLNIVIGNFVQITANSSTAAHVNYEIAQITGYSGSTLVVTATTAVGSGTFANWLLDVYPLNGDLAASNIALRFTGCSDVQSIHNNFSGRFYNALDSRNGNNVIFDHNLVTGFVNRGIHMGAYVSGNSASNNQATFNFVNGASFSQYCINTSASDAAVGIGYLIKGNRLLNCTFQGMVLAGGVTYSEIVDNSIQMAFNTSGVGILIEQLVGTITQSPSQITVGHNTVDLGAEGVFASNLLYSALTGNTVAGSGVGYEFSGPTAIATAYNTIAGNIAEGCTSHGFYFTGGAAGGVYGQAVNGNTSTANGGWGFLSDANTGSSNYNGNTALGNVTGSYSLAGSGNVTAGGNL